MKTILDSEIKRLDHELRTLIGFRRYYVQRLWIIDHILRSLESKGDKDSKLIYESLQKMFADKLKIVLDRGLAIAPIYFSLIDHRMFLHIFVLHHHVLRNDLFQLMVPYNK